MKLRTVIIVLIVLAATGINPSFGSRASLSLAEKVTRADAIVVGEVAEIEAKRYSLTLYEQDSNGKQPRTTTFYNLAVLHPKTILKADTENMVNKADKSNPVAWMHMAYQTPGQEEVFASPYPVPHKGERRIWFLRRDKVLTGHYFIREAEPIVDATIQEIEQLLAEQQSEKE